MSSGLKKEIKIGFLNEQTSTWLGGVNYFKNLFIALSKVENPKLIPYIYTPRDEAVKFLLNFAKPLEDESDMDVISHSDLILEKPTISWIPDFQHLHLPEIFSQNDIAHRRQDHLNKATFSDIMLFSSENAFSDFKKFTPHFAHKGRVLNFVAILEDDVYVKTDEIKEQTIKKFNLPEKYFYVPNQFWEHKNHKVVFEALSILKNDIKIVFSGNTEDYRNKEHFQSLMQFARENGIENNIINLGIVNLIEVYYLMRNSISIINPSFFEGWSSTVEEAKSLGKNIILSDIEVHREQNPDSGVYFDPNNAKELAQILKDKWENGAGPDFELEKKAQANIEKRILDFGLEYQKIVLEIFS